MGDLRRPAAILGFPLTRHQFGGLRALTRLGVAGGRLRGGGPRLLGGFALLVLARLESQPLLGLVGGPGGGGGTVGLLGLPPARGDLRLHPHALGGERGRPFLRVALAAGDLGHACGLFLLAPARQGLGGAGALLGLLLLGGGQSLRLLARGLGGLGLLGLVALACGLPIEALALVLRGPLLTLVLVALPRRLALLTQALVLLAGEALQRPEALLRLRDQRATSCRSR